MCQAYTLVNISLEDRGASGPPRKKREKKGPLAGRTIMTNPESYDHHGRSRAKQTPNRQLAWARTQPPPACAATSRPTANQSPLSVQRPPNWPFAWSFSENLIFPILGKIGPKKREFMQSLGFPRINSFLCLSWDFWIGFLREVFLKNLFFPILGNIGPKKKEFTQSLDFPRNSPE